MTKYLDLKLEEIHELLRSKVIKPIDLVEEALARLEQAKDLNAFITVCADEARKQALALSLKEVPDNLLFGIPIAIKDNIITKDIRTTAASKMLEDFVPIYDAFVIEEIKKNDLIIIGKLNMDEFAMGSSNQTSYFGNVLNPWNKKLVPGGSSGGVAAAVAQRIVPLALGTDTGGSIRQPSSFCGIVGLKPTYGRISRFGLIAFASSLDVIGPMTRNVLDNATLLNILCKKDERDLTQSAKEEDFKRLIGQDITGLKIAIPNFYMNDKIDEEIKAKVQEIVLLLKESGCEVSYIDMPYLEHAVPLYQIIALGEASSNLAGFDGIKYGYATDNSENLYDFYAKTRMEGFGSEVKRRIMIGSYLLSGPNAKTYYEKALKIRKQLANTFQAVFKDYDFIIGPTTTSLPYEVGKDLDDAVKSFLDDILTIPVNMAGLPGMSLPIGFSKEHLPIGMQIIANRFEEAKIYQLASYIEKKLALNLDLKGGENNEL